VNVVAERSENSLYGGIWSRERERGRMNGNTHKFALVHAAQKVHRGQDQSRAQGTSPTHFFHTRTNSFCKPDLSGLNTKPGKCNPV
jgi:hypothetical protein